ncbi:MAG: hypothetical protein KatS3mg109_0747 [Pirellulaceae bacterium]|nr:MAG: hypothetical protein KatS3mg109_0747 [Pirellulaceae bacterium]
MKNFVLATLQRCFGSSLLGALSLGKSLLTAHCYREEARNAGKKFLARRPQLLKSEPEQTGGVRHVAWL